MILSLPSYMFGVPIISIKQSENEDSDNDSEMNEYDIFISQLILVFKTNSSPPSMTYRTLNGAQLRPLICDNGRFFIGHIQRYYPLLDTIIIKYIKFPVVKGNPLSQLIHAQTSDTPKTITRVLDVQKRFDIRNGASCKLGIVL